MTAVSVLSSKGGVGASTLVTNLGVALAQGSSCLLVDLCPGLGNDDLLLDLKAKYTWGDLLPVAAELTTHHLDLALVGHASGLQLLAAPAVNPPGSARGYLLTLLQALASRFEWLLLDLPPGIGSLPRLGASLADIALLMATADPPALRNLHRLLEAMPEGWRSRSGLVLNQIGRRHPVDPASVAASLGLPLMAALPVDRAAVASQVNLGKPCAHDGRSPLGRAFVALARQLVTAKGQLGRSGGAEWHVAKVVGNTEGMMEA